ncbi:NADH-ubiquinone oxidoreductase 12 kDa subunit [Ceratocystis lukuohia]|uniref:NADH-ubiquinone oxidoreductase 12 kDa subunit n=1 Tax=Ceratocystis lukuohia TaxID=2019550 RepID=A0ABR4MLW0_9PEZI
MPTPESEMFLAQKPKVPPTFDGVDYDDHNAFKAAQDAIIREQWVGAMMVRLVGEELGKCYMREGVNHLENCGQLREHAFSLPPLERYLTLLKEKKVTGPLFQQLNYIKKQEKQ